MGSLARTGLFIVAWVIARSSMGIENKYEWGKWEIVVFFVSALVFGLVLYEIERRTREDERRTYRSYDGYSRRRV
jgi:hypothetical protein